MQGWDDVEIPSKSKGGKKPEVKPTSQQAPAPAQTQTQAPVQPKAPAPAPVQEETKGEVIVSTKYSSSDKESTHLLIRAKEGLFFQNYKLKTLDPASQLLKNCTDAEFINNGKYILAYNSEGLHRFETEKLEARATLALLNITMWDISPANNFVSVLTKKDKEIHVLTVVDLKTMSEAYSLEVLKFVKDSWPLIFYSADDSIVLKRFERNRVHLMQTGGKFIPLPDMTSKVNIDVLSLSRSALGTGAPNYAFIGSLQNVARTNKPKFAFFDLQNPKTPVCDGEFDLGHELKVIWSPTGQECLIWAQTFRDQSDKSYYGESVLYHFTVKSAAVKKVPKYEGPVHDVMWSPRGNEFIAITGFMPASIILFNNNCVPKFEFGKLYFNTIKWSPLGRFVSLCGFGSLNGSIEIWDSTSNSKVGSCRASSSITSEWAPDGRKFYTSVINPRLRVDNQYKVFNYRGDMVNFVDLKATELYEVQWAPGKFTDRPPSPKSLEEKKTAPEPEKKPKRMLTTRGDDFIAQERETQGSRYFNPTDKVGTAVPKKPAGWIPGMATEPEPEKKKKKRNRKKKTDGGDGKDDDGDDGN